MYACLPCVFGHELAVALDYLRLINISRVLSPGGCLVLGLSSIAVGIYCTILFAFCLSAWKPEIGQVVTADSCPLGLGLVCVLFSEQHAFGQWLVAVSIKTLSLICWQAMGGQPDQCYEGCF